jgi:hypothetical protein
MTLKKSELYSPLWQHSRDQTRDLNQGMMQEPSLGGQDSYEL